ncbi:peptide chain release factor N(5)-glutamine methyltransferase [Gehongia tenuis]|uniref:Release factor glutamine methyltransferase n=1 Tax=Gehongia tenuis TaxID=2763655 RepID=A0A926D5G1_9FIRM|nr:peptide chain release factor N(5)-glutamine methyltransferase [Gehongia tenuis]
MNIRKALQTMTEALKARTEEPRWEARMILAHVTRQKPAELLFKLDEPLSQPLWATCRELTAKRREGHPLQYLVGEWDFMGETFYVEPGVLIPRPETELLVEEALRCLSPKSVFADVGVGSGAIALSVLKRMPGAKAYGLDVNERALALSQKNAQRLAVEDRITLLRSDLFSGLSEDVRLDGVLSNPPYIPTGDIEGLMTEVRDHEPLSALDGGADGLDFYRRLAGEPMPLKKGGVMLLELGQGQDSSVRQIMAPLFERTYCIQDYSGIPRIFVGCGWLKE